MLNKFARSAAQNASSLHNVWSKIVTPVVSACECWCAEKKRRNDNHHDWLVAHETILPSLSFRALVLFQRKKHIRLLASGYYYVSRGAFACSHYFKLSCSLGLSSQVLVTKKKTQRTRLAEQTRHGKFLAMISDEGRRSCRPISLPISDAPCVPEWRRPNVARICWRGEYLRGEAHENILNLMRFSTR